MQCKQCIKLNNWTKDLEKVGVRQRRTVMRVSPDTHQLSYLNLTLILFSSFSALSSSSSPSCELQVPFILNRFHKAGDVVLGGLFPIHTVYIPPEVNFTSKKLHPNCT